MEIALCLQGSQRIHISSHSVQYFLKAFFKETSVSNFTSLFICYPAIPANCHQGKMERTNLVACSATTLFRLDYPIVTIDSTFIVGCSGNLFISAASNIFRSIYSNSALTVSPCSSSDLHNTDISFTTLPFEECETEGAASTPYVVLARAFSFALRWIFFFILG
jgi:hypothetical protein